MTITQDTEIDIFVASKIGSFKHIKYHTDSSKNNKKCIENLVDIKTLQKGDEITCLRWGNKDQTQILIGRRNQQIETYSTLSATTSTALTSPDPGHITGLGISNDILISAASSGIVRAWLNCGQLKDDVTSEEINTGGKLDVMVVCDEEPVFATGGEENDLKIFNIETKEATFTAKNLAHDWLQLRRPVWVSAAAFSPAEGGRVAAVCSRYGYVRLYDSRTQRRPVLNVEFPNMAATCIVPSFDERMYLVGFGRGQLHQVDLRNGRPDKGYKGCAGAVTDISIYKTNRLIVSTSLDRHLRVHHYESKEMVYKQYLTSKLTRVLLQTENHTPLKNSPVEIKQEPAECEVDASRWLDAANDMDDIFQHMETVGERESKKKSILPLKEPKTKKLKPSTEGSTSISEVASDDAIAQLLRSTEKTKRKREKKKKEKRAKSIFFNA